MALAFQKKPVARLTASLSDEDKTVSLEGITTANVTPEECVTQVNKIYAIGGRSIRTSTVMKITETKEVTNDG